MDVNLDYSASFKNISMKLKKRFLKKPNVADAIEEYTALSRQLESEECFGLSAYCMQQVAKSYHSVGNTILESAALQQAAKLYLNSEIVSTIETGTVTFKEDLTSAISLYEEVIKLHCDQNERQLAAKVCLELADLLAQKFERYFEALPYYERSITLFSPITPLEQSNILQILLVQSKLAALKVFTCDYSGALNLYTDICNMITSKCTIQQPKQLSPPQPSSSLPTASSSSRTTSTSSSVTINAAAAKLANEFAAATNLNAMSNSKTTAAAASANVILNKPIGYFSHLLVQSEICKLLLLLYLKPTKLKPEHSATLDVFGWFQSLSDNSVNTYLPLSCIDKDLFILLQSFVMACQSNENDVKMLSILQGELWSYCNDVQNHLIDMIIDQLLNSSYTDDLLTEQV